MLLDVREDYEWVAGHAPDAVHIPMSQLAGRLAEVPKDQELVVVCKVGARSAQVAAYLRQHGWPQVENYDGGMEAWVASGGAIVSETGTPPAIV